MIKEILEKLNQDGEEVDIPDTEFNTDVGKILKKFNFVTDDNSNLSFGMVVYHHKLDDDASSGVVYLYSSSGRRAIDLGNIKEKKIIPKIIKRLKPIINRYRGYVINTQIEFESYDKSSN